MRLLRLVHVAFWLRQPLQALLPAIGIALGVAAVVAIDLGASGTVTSFRNTLEAIDGRTTDQVFPGAGPLDGTLASRLAELPGVLAAAPVVDVMSLAAEPLRLIGIDPFEERGVRTLGAERLLHGPGNLFTRFLGQPGALLVSAPYLERHRLHPGDSLDVAVGSFRRRAFVLAALPDTVDGFHVPDNLAVADIATVQELAGRADVSRIDLVIAPDARAAAMARVCALLPGGAAVKPAGGSAAYLEGLLAALRLNLNALSYLALFVALFLIYNAMLVAMLARRRELAIVRCLGATRGEVLRAWLLEAAAIGILGTVLGLAAGWFAGRLALRGIAQTTTDLYAYVRVSGAAIRPLTLAKAIAAGVGGTLLAAFPLAAEAARTPPAHTSSRSELERTARRRLRRAPLLALPLVAVTVGSLAFPSRSPLAGYVAAVALLGAVSLIVPVASDALVSRAEAAGGAASGIAGTGIAASIVLLARLAVGNIRASLSRTGVALAALTAALAMSIAMGTMVASFRDELHRWIDNVVRADIYISPATSTVDRLDARLDPALVDRLRARPGVVAMDSYRALPARVRGLDTFVAGIEVRVYGTRSVPRVLQGPPPARFLGDLARGEAGVSETLARRAGIAPGDSVVVAAAGRTTTVRVSGIYRDYTSDRGVVLLDLPRFQADFGEQAPNSVALYLAPGADAARAADSLRSELGARYALLIRTNRNLRGQAYLVFDRTFVVARTLEVIGIAVAAIGILAALLAMLLERGRELATLRSLGLGATALQGMLLLESALMATIAWFFALLSGTALSLILLRVVNVRSFGWMLPFHLPWREWLANLGWGLLAAGVAAAYPLWRSRRLSIAAALREE